MKFPEFPACAAIRLLPGVVIAGKRHDVCIQSAVLAGFSRDDIATAIRGFMTTRGNFVSRKEGWRMAVETGIVIDRPGAKILFSEDLY